MPHECFALRLSYGGSECPAFIRAFLTTAQVRFWSVCWSQTVRGYGLIIKEYTEWGWSGLDWVIEFDIGLIGWSGLIGVWLRSIIHCAAKLQRQHSAIDKNWLPHSRSISHGFNPVRTHSLLGKFVESMENRPAPGTFLATLTAISAICASPAVSASRSPNIIQIKFVTKNVIAYLLW